MMMTMMKTTTTAAAAAAAGGRRCNNGAPTKGAEDDDDNCGKGGGGVVRRVAAAASCLAVNALSRGLLPGNGAAAALEVLAASDDEPSPSSCSSSSLTMGMGDDAAARIPPEVGKALLFRSTDVSQRLTEDEQDILRRYREQRKIEAAEQKEAARLAKLPTSQLKITPENPVLKDVVLPVSGGLWNGRKVSNVTVLQRESNGNMYSGPRAEWTKRNAWYVLEVTLTDDEGDEPPTSTTTRTVLGAPLLQLLPNEFAVRNAAGHSPSVSAYFGTVYLAEDEPVALVALPPALTLAKWIQEKDLLMKDKKAVCTKLAAIVEHLHANSVEHGNISLQSFSLPQKDEKTLVLEPVLTGWFFWGVNRAVEEFGPPTVPRPLPPAYDPMYAPPEVQDKDKRPNFLPYQADVFALGKVVKEIAVSKREVGAAAPVTTTELNAIEDPVLRKFVEMTMKELPLERWTSSEAAAYLASDGAVEPPRRGGGGAVPKKSGAAEAGPQARSKTVTKTGQQSTFGTARGQKSIVLVGRKSVVPAKTGQPPKRKTSGSKAPSLQSVRRTMQKAQ